MFLKASEIDSATFFEMKVECRVSCVKLVVWSIVAQKGTNILIFIFSNMMLNMVVNVAGNLLEISKVTGRILSLKFSCRNIVNLVLV